MIPIIIILPLGLAYAKFGPKTYATKSLMLLQESGRDSPFGSELQTTNSLQGRIAGLQALLKSERVLLRVMSDIEGPNTPTDKKEIATWLKEFSSNLSLELVGSDFLQFELIGKTPVGLGKQLEAVTSRFLEAILSSQDAMSATHVLIARKKAELDALVEEHERLSAEVAQRPPAAQQAEIAALIKQKSILEQKGQELSALAIEVEILRRSTGGAEATAPENTAQVPAKTERAEAGTDRAETAKPYTTTAAANDPARKQSTSAADSPASLSADQAQLKTLEARYSTLAAEVIRLERSTEAMERAFNERASAGKRLRDLELAVQKTRESFQDYSKRFVAPIGVRSSSILTAPERIKVIDEPRDPELPIRSALKIAIGAFIASMLAAGGLVFLAELLDSTVRRSDEIEELTGAPILARLPAA